MMAYSSAIIVMDLICSYHFSKSTILTHASEKMNMCESSAVFMDNDNCNCCDLNGKCNNGQCFDRCHQA